MSTTRHYVISVRGNLKLSSAGRRQRQEDTQEADRCWRSGVRVSPIHTYTNTGRGFTRLFLFGWISFLISVHFKLEWSSSEFLLKFSLILWKSGWAAKHFHGVNTTMSCTDDARVIAKKVILTKSKNNWSQITILILNFATSWTP